MPFSLTAVDHDPFAPPSVFSLTPVDHDPFADALAPELAATPGIARAESYLARDAADTVNNTTLSSALPDFLKNASLVDMAKSLAETPRDAIELGQDLSDTLRAGGHVTPDQAGRSLNVAGTLAAGGMPMAEKGAFGAFGGGGSIGGGLAYRSPASNFADKFTKLDYAALRPTIGGRDRFQGLTPSAADEVAAAQGYNTDYPLFKGMEKPIEGEGFRDPSTRPGEKAVFFADNPRIANQYTNLDRKTSGLNAVPTYAAPKNPLTVNWPDISGSTRYEGYTMKRAIDHARSQGADLLHITNIDDVGGVANQIAVLDPRILRARHAAFDPAAQGVSNDILATAGSPMLGSILGVNRQTSN